MRGEVSNKPPGLQAATRHGARDPSQIASPAGARAGFERASPVCPVLALNYGLWRPREGVQSRKDAAPIYCVGPVRDLSGQAQSAGLRERPLFTLPSSSRACYLGPQLGPYLITGARIHVFGLFQILVLR